MEEEKLSARSRAARWAGCLCCTPWASGPRSAPGGSVPGLSSGSPSPGAAGAEPVPAALCKRNPRRFSASQTRYKPPQRTLHPDCRDLIPAPPAAVKVQGRGALTASDAAQLAPLLPARTKAPGPGSGCRMRLLFEAAVLCLTLGLGHSTEDTTQENAAHQSSSTESYFPEWGIGAIRDSFETVNSYFDSFLELLGGKNGVCQYRCRYGKCRASVLGTWGC